MPKIDRQELYFKPEGYCIRLLVDKVNELEDRIAELEEANEGRL